jgi:heat shock protein HtpX
VEPAGLRLAVTEGEIAANRRRVALLAAAAGCVPGLLAGVIVGAAVGTLAGLVVAVAVAVAVAVVVPRRATRLVLHLVGGRAVGDEDEPRLANLVAGLCATFGVPRPRLWVVHDGVPNACAVGRRPSSAVLVVTTGLLDRLGLIELEGVVAHELVHVKRHDTAVSETAIAVLAPLTRLTGRDGIVHAVVGRGREYRADEVAAATVRYPPGLHDALALMEQGPEPSAGSVFRGSRWTATRWLWVDPMVGDRRAAAVGELDATALRRDALAEW